MSADSNDQLLEGVREINLAYLMLAQQMIRLDRAQALYRLGISDEVAKVIARLTPSQVMRIAGTKQLICRFRFDDDVVWNLLTNPSKSGAAAGSVADLHASIVMASHNTEDR
jgi:flagellar transcriptional activator FlhD